MIPLAGFTESSFSPYLTTYFSGSVRRERIEPESFQPSGFLNLRALPERQLRAAVRSGRLVEEILP